MSYQFSQNFKKSPRKKRADSFFKIGWAWHFRNYRRLFFMGILLLVCVVLIFSSIYKWHEKIWSNSTKSFHTYAKFYGFKVENFEISGRKNLPKKRLESLVGYQRGDSIFNFDMTAHRLKIAKEPWVKNVIIKRILPNTIRIQITERIPLAYWHKGKNIFISYSDGYTQLIQKSKQFDHLYTISGKNAPKNFPSFITEFKDYSNILKVTRAFCYVRCYRWNLILNNGLTVKLPETNVSQALTTLKKLLDNYKLIDKKIIVIDLRDPSRIWLRAKE